MEKKGVDLVTIAGYEVAGHPSAAGVGTFVIARRVASQLKIPVVAAGGIADRPRPPAENPRRDCESARTHAPPHPYLRHLPGASAAGAQSGRKDRQAEVRPPRRKSAREGRQDRAVLHDEPEPRLCGGLRHAAGKRVPAFCQRQRRHL